MRFELYKKVLTSDGETSQQRAITRLHRDIVELSSENPSYKQVKINGEDRNLIINSTQDPFVKNICALPHEPLCVGNHIEFANHDYYVLSCSCDDGVYAYGKMERCNEVVRFISPYDGSIVEYPTLITNTTKFNTGETPNKRLTLVSGQYAMILPIDKHTVLIDNEFRFLIDKRKDYPSAYRVTYIDTATYGYDDGLLNVVLLQCDYNPDTDNAELMVANYYKPHRSAAPDEKIILSDANPVIRVGGAKKTFTPILTDQVVLPLVFHVSMIDDIAPYVSYETTDTAITFQVQNDFRLIGNVVSLTISDSGDIPANTVYIKIGGLV